MATQRRTRQVLRRVAGALAGVALSALAGCQSGPAFKPAPPPPDGDALVYVYREYNLLAGGISPHLWMDGTPLAWMEIGGYARFYTPPGTARFSVDGGYLPRIEITADGPNYLRYEYIEQAGGLDKDTGSLTKVAPEVGLEEIASCNLYVEHAKKWPKEPPRITGKRRGPQGP